MKSNILNQHISLSDIGLLQVILARPSHIVQSVICSFVTGEVLTAGFENFVLNRNICKQNLSVKAANICSAKAQAYRELLA